MYLHVFVDNFHEICLHEYVFLSELANILPFFFIPTQIL